METCSVRAEDMDLGMVWEALKVGQKESCAKNQGWDIYAIKPEMGRTTICK